MHYLHHTVINHVHLVNLKLLLKFNPTFLTNTVWSRSLRKSPVENAKIFSLRIHLRYFVVLFHFFVLISGCLPFDSFLSLDASTEY